MTKTIVILAIVAAFMVGTSMSFVVPNFEAEAKNEKEKPGLGTSPGLEEVLAKLDELKEDTDAIKSTGNDHGIILGDLSSTGNDHGVILDDLQSTGNDHGIILGDLQTTVSSIDGKADGIKSVVDTIDAKVP